MLPAVRQCILNRLENTCDLVFHVDGTATPNVGVVHMPAKGDIRPVSLGAGHHGNHVHVAHEHDGLKGGVGTGKRHEQRMVDKLDLARRKYVRPGLLHIGAQVGERLPVHRLASMLEMVGNDSMRPRRSHAPALSKSAKSSSCAKKRQTSAMTSFRL